MRILAVCLTGCILDVVFGDPHWLYHPVRLIGALIAKCEQICRQIAKRSKRRLLIGGGVLFVVVLLVSAAAPAGMLYLAAKIHPLLSFALESFWCYQILAARSLQTESMKVYRELKKQDLQAARRAVSMIVRRDTESLGLRGSDKGGGGDRRGEYVRRRDRPASVSADRRRAPGICLQGGQHDGFNAWI